MPLTSTLSSPFSISPERLDRSIKEYSSENTVLCAQILNIGGTENWSKKLTLQTAFADKLVLVHRKIDLGSDTNKTTGWKFLTNLLKACRGRSRSRGSNPMRVDNAGEFNITRKYIVDLVVRQRFRCAISNIPLVFESNQSWTASIDRKVNSMGYVKGNVRVTIKQYNGSFTWTKDAFGMFKAQVIKNIGTIEASYRSDIGDKGEVHIMKLIQ